MKPKYNPGQTVIAGGRETEIVSMSFANNEWRYSVKSQEWDAKQRKVIEGIEHYQEAELSEVKKDE